MDTQSLIANAKHLFKPQPGKQTDFLSTWADIALYGGGAGGGKTFALLLETLRHHKNSKFRSVIFRRESVQITNPGGLWDETLKIYPAFEADSNKQMLEWKFPSGYVAKFAHLQHEADVHNWQGAQIPLIGFDELTHFTESQFWYMLSRNRSDSGVPGYIRATCNPPDGKEKQEKWVTDLIAWWLTPDGFPDPHKSGIVRWFCRINNVVLWGDSKQELVNAHGVQEIDCKSFTFIPATIEDNQILLQRDPAYISNLRALNDADKRRLLFGNWKVSSAGNLFNPHDLKMFTMLPRQRDYKVIVVDTAQKAKEHNDYTVFQAWVLSDKRIYLQDQVRGRFEYPLLKSMASSFIGRHKDANKTYIEDTVAGTSLIQDLTASNIPVEAVTRRKDKFTRAKESEKYITGGFVFVNPIADYFNEFVGEVTGFRGDMKHDHDDQIDCMFDAIDKLLINPPALAVHSRNYHNLSSDIV